MITSATIRNFRCFADAKLENCRRINVVVGNNAVGKTALLEALFLAMGPSPEIALRFRSWRGYERAMSGTQQDIEEATWSDLFYQFDLANLIEIAIRGSEKHNRTLSISYAAHETFVPTTEDNIQSTFAPSPIAFEWTRHDGTRFMVKPQFTGSGYQFVGVEHPTVEATLFVSTNPFSTAETVKRFSLLDKRREAAGVVRDIINEFSTIRDIDIQSHAGVSMLHADIPHLPEKIPLSMISSGVNKFVTLMVSIAAQPRSVVFVDEIENGLYYDRLSSIWRALYKNCRQAHVQLFVSTHSRECLEALAEACKDNPDDVSLIRAEILDGRASLEQFDGSAFFPGVTTGEFR